MKFTLSWLKTYLKTDASLEEICTTLTNLGLVVDKVEDKSAALKPFKVVKIIEATQHPNADRLKVCRIETGEGEVQVVCGGANARTGIKAVLARPGDKIPSSGQALKLGEIRGVQSQGMLCSLEELLLAETSEGIIEAPEDAAVGAVYAEVLGLNDPFIEIEITPNRGDCLGVYGVARDLAATGIGQLTPPPSPTLSLHDQTSIQTILEDPESCPYFTTRLISDVNNSGQSPEWMLRRLQSIGAKVISPLVDVTNFMAFDQGRPLHVFDADKIKGNLRIGLSQGGESFEALDGNTYTLEDGMIIISDDSGIISLGGIMGGASTAVGSTTTNVLLESAYFDPVRIAMAGRKLGIHSDARYRLERGVDPQTALPGLDYATQMILEISGGKASQAYVAGHNPRVPKVITFEPKRTATLGGLAVDKSESQNILKALGYGIESCDGLFHATPPSWRFDVEIEADLVEDILRVKGYDHISSVPFSSDRTHFPLSASQARSFEVRSLLAGRGLTELITWSFISEPLSKLFGGGLSDLTLTNPISEEMKVMRPSILPNLLEAASKNITRGQAQGAYFEVGPQYQNATDKGQDLMASGLRYGTVSSSNWSTRANPLDLFHTKADAMAVLKSMGVNVGNIQCTRETPAWYHPGRSGVFKQGPNVLAYFGEIHPKILKKFDLKGPVVAFEIFVKAVPLPKSKTKKQKLTLSPYQMVERDFAFIISQDTPADSLRLLAQKADPALVQEVVIFDHFADPKLGEGKVSLGLRVKLQAPDRTLTDEEINVISKRLIDSIHAKTGGTLRQ
ncbi:Phenylalanine--tRNA ligase beta subunit [Candidatus Bealeia paramacronuclearis]|uniref:Phenylalanine--tRNA ligase beta subunit n=1 Tax=Candidatus Bealeia paramacronuclearis TaxID=1921001 RepID=A0ABZ2C4B9_9PROT|nr:Phenylalanine--tRNA ligase beta subunit [Candidatus Bealeia paramacronuclearis]